MANIVDELILQLRLDTSKFNQEQQKTVRHLREMENIQRKGSKEDQKRLEETTYGYRKLRDAVVGFGTALAGVNGFKGLMTNTVGTDTSLWRQSQLLGVHARSLNAWGYAAEKFGGSQAGVAASLQNMEGAWAKFKLGQGGLEFTTAMSRLGLHGPQDFKNFSLLSRHLMAVKRAYGEQGALQSASALGLDKGTFLMLMQGPAKVQELYRQAYRLSGVTRQNTTEAQKLYEQWVNLKEIFGADAQMVFHDVYPALTKLAQISEILLTDFRRLDTATHGWAGKLLTLGATIMTLRAPFAILKNLRGLLGAESAAGLGLLGKGGLVGSAGAAGYAVGKYGVDPAANLLGQKITGNKNWSLSGAGGTLLFNMFHGGAHPMNSTDGAAQLAAMRKKYHIVMGPHGWTRQGAQQGNLLAHASRAHMVGAHATAPVVVKGNSSVETNIQAIHVNAPNATDANGVARDMKSALQHNALITGGIRGVR